MPCIVKSRVVTSTLTSKDQAITPKDIRKRFNLYLGARLEFVGDENGRIMVLLEGMAVSELVAHAQSAANSVSVAEMNQAIFE
jgi:bifunctional DNA-binding transcriptional regulator/antitoxin component of YhaV-PrlF toxin-antitoxin module